MTISSTWLTIWFIGTCLLIGLAVGQSIAVVLLRRELAAVRRIHSEVVASKVQQDIVAALNRKTDVTPPKDIW